MENDSNFVNETLELEYSKNQFEKYSDELSEKYESKLRINPKIKRSIISFQANKTEPFYRWFKYKEGFSTSFVKNVLDQFGKSGENQVVLDPFSGIGTTITTSLENGYNAIGIELLAPGIAATKARVASRKINSDQLRELICKIRNLDFNSDKLADKYWFQHLNITSGAFSSETENGIATSRSFLEKECNGNLKFLLHFAVLSILEEVSYTRKDGQYLRWDHRSPRKLKSKFNKGKIHDFKTKLLEKLEIIQEDVELQERLSFKNEYKLIEGSCLTELRNIENESIDLVITSPPYCNRYDYTRTYALELAFSGIDDKKIKELRQTLLSATVENKSKFNELKEFYKSENKSDFFEESIKAYSEQKALKEILADLNNSKPDLNNKNIPNMVSNYFFEMNFVIRELAQKMKPSGKIIMVNDNVRYNGREIPVDLLLSELAEFAGLKTDVIWVLERGKGNSSQQMGQHGRKEIRKCVYIWSKTLDG